MKMVFGSVVMVVFQSVVYSKILQNKIQKHKKKNLIKKILILSNPCLKCNTKQERRVIR
jgi:hypothetical protein